MAHYTSGGNWRPTIPNQTCGLCGRSYTAHSYKQRFCGNDCKALSLRKRVSQKCESCGVAFEAKPSSRRRFCSTACKHVAARKKTEAKRQRKCVVCGTDFLAKSAYHLGRTCSKPCLQKHMADKGRGRKRSPEALAKQRRSLRAAWADPKVSSKWRAGIREAMTDWHSDPTNAKAFAQRSSDRMRRRHADPEWQKVRDERSSRIMKENWGRYRDQFIAATYERYFQHREAGIGLHSEEAKRKRSERSKWIMKRSQEALHAETDYDATFTEVQARLRREMPYDGPQTDSDYLDYCQKLGTAVVNSPECRAIADTFMSEAISRFAEEWNRLKQAA